MCQLNRDKAAIIIKATISIKSRNQTEVARKIGIDRAILNMYLNRKLDLLPLQIEALFDELNIRETWDRLSAPVSTDI